MKFKSFLVLVVALIVSNAVMASKLYKIVDENGNVTFSQFPPVPSKETQSLKVEEKQVKNEVKSRLIKKGDSEFCGNIQLPSQRDRKEYFFSEVANRMKYWKENLERKEEQLRKSQENHLKQSAQRAKYGSSSSRSKYYLERNKQTEDAMKDLRCAIEWGNSHHAETQQAKQTMSSELSRLQGTLLKLTDKRTSKCGPEPIYDPTVADNKRLRTAWKKCSRQFKSDIRKLERLISKESRKLERF